MLSFFICEFPCWWIKIMFLYLFPLFCHFSFPTPIGCVSKHDINALCHLSGNMSLAFHWRSTQGNWWWWQVWHSGCLWSLRRHRHSPEKVNQGMILAPLVRIISNLLDARVGMECGQQNDVVDVFASMDCPDAVRCGFQYLLEYNWTMSSRGDAYSGKLKQLESFLSLLISRIELQRIERMKYGEETEAYDNTCCICYSCKADALFAPCSHRSCYGCITILMKNG